MKSFLVWLEGEESPGLSEPQHKQGESNMGLEAMVERRMKQIIMELESSGKGTQQEILSAVQKYLGAKGIGQKEARPEMQTQQQQPEQMQQAVMQGQV